MSGLASAPRGAATTIVAIATAAGEGAIGIVRLSGPAALTLLRRLCPGQLFFPYRLKRADLCLPEEGRPLDQVLVCFMPAPRSYTGEDVVEVYAHGGVLNLQRLLTVFYELGARAAQPGEFTRRAFVNGRLDLLQAESVSQIIAARSEAALQNAQAVLRGDLGRRLGELRQQVVRLAAQLEAAIDFADELETQPSPAELISLCQQAEGSLQGQLESYRLGRRLDGASVALVGSVNVGKSSLFNALLGRKRALVSSEPGTTRDYLEAEVNWRGHRLVLYDTVGERPEQELSELERAGREMVQPMLEQCELLLAVVDLAAPAPLSPGALASFQRPLIVVGNKADCASEEQLALFPQRLAAAVAPLACPPLAITSALTGQGVERLREAMREALFPAAGSAGQGEGVQITSRRHYEALMRASAELRAGREAVAASVAPELAVEHVRAALESLGEITGESASEEVLDAVFASFCIGK